MLQKFGIDGYLFTERFNRICKWLEALNSDLMALTLFVEQGNVGRDGAMEMSVEFDLSEVG